MALDPASQKRMKILKFLQDCGGLCDIVKFLVETTLWVLVVIVRLPPFLFGEPPALLRYG